MSVYASYVTVRVYATTADAFANSAPDTATYSDHREYVGATNSTASTGRIGQSNSGGLYSTKQYLPVFDTTTVVAGALSTGTFSFVVNNAPATVADVLELRGVSSVANAIAGSALASQTPLYGSWTVVTGTGRKTLTLDVSSGMPRSATASMVFASRNQRLNVAPSGPDEGPNIAGADTTGTTNDPYLDITPTPPWTVVGVSSVVTDTATTLTLTEPAGVANGDLLVACIASRTTATTAVSNTGWTAVNSQNNNNTLATTSGIASGTMLYQIRAGTPDLTFVIPAGISVAMGAIVAYRGHATTTPLDASTAATTAAVTTACSWTGLTTTQDDDLIVAMVAGGQEAAWSAFTNVTTPLTSSGATNTTSAPSATAWTERADSLTTTGADTSLAIFDAVRTGSGATGNLTATASVAGGNVVIAGAFKIAPPPTADAWNYQDKSANITLSNSDKTATAASSTGAGVRSTRTQLNGAAGKWYAEILLDASPAPRHGINAVSNALSTTSGTVQVATSSGNILINGSSTGSNVGSALVASDILCVAWDSGAERIWFRKNGGNWNNSGSADPASGAGAVDASAAASEAHALWFSLSTIGQGATIRTEAAEFTQSGPSGFTSWMGEALGPTAYTMPAVAGAYALTGAAATPELGRLVTADVGSYALTGAAATLSKGAAVIAYNMPAAAGAYALTGATAGLYRGREVLAVAGSYALTGAAASLEYGREVAAVSGSYALTGTAASLESGREVLAAPGSYAVAGAAATLKHDWKLGAVSGAYALTGTAATLTRAVNKVVAAAPGSYSMAGQTASLLRGDRLSAVAGSYALTGAAALAKHGWKTAAITGAYALTGTAAAFRRTFKIAAVSGSYSLSGTAAAFVRTYKPAAVSGAYTLTGTGASLESGREIAALGGSYALSGVATSLEKGREVLAEAGAYALTGTAASFIRARRVAALGSSYALSGIPVNLLKPGAYAIIGLPGSYTLAGVAASLEWNRKFLALGGSYALTGATASLERGREVLAAAGAYTVTGAAISLERGREVAADTGSYALAGSAALLFKTEAAGLVGVWNGSAWVDKPAKVWTGAVWAQKPVKYWNGSAWA